MRTPRRPPAVAAAAATLALQVGACTAATASLLDGPLIGGASAATPAPPAAGESANPVAPDPPHPSETAASTSAPTSAPVPASSAVPSAAPSVPGSTASASPHLAISLDDGRASAVPGDRVTWKLTVRDLGSEPVTGLRIEQHLPDGAKPAESGDAVLRDGNQIWEHVAVEPDAPTTLTSTADLGPTGPETLRSSSTACAYAGDSGTPLVCASHQDLLPAGRRALAVAGHDERPVWPWWTGSLLAVLTGAAAGIWVRGRRRNGASTWI